MLRLWKRKPGTPLSQEELQQRRDAAEASAAKRRGQDGGRGSLDLFRSEIRRIPLLEADQERALLNRWTKDKDPKAREKILAAHLRMSFAGARKLSGYGMPLEDLVAAGNIGLMQALERYDPEQAGGARFATFAQKYMMAAQLAHVQNSWSIVRMGTNRDQKRLFFKLREDLRQAGDVLDDKAAEEIARKRGVKVGAVWEMAGRFTGRDASLNQSLGDDGEGDEWVDRLVGGGEHAEISMERKQQDTLRRAALSRAMASLPERQRRVFAARQLRQPPATLHQISKEMGISAERVRQIEAQAFTALRQSVAKDPRLNKRTPGAPLSDAEREQRRNAALARWAGAGAGAAIGAGVAEGAVQGGAKLASRWLTAKDEKAPRRARRLSALRRELRLGQIERTAEARYRAAGKPFNRELEAEKGRPGPITQRVRDLKALKARGPKQLAALDARLTELQDAFERGDTPKPGLGWREATIARERLRDDLARVDGEIAELSQQTPAKKKVVQVHRGAAGLFSSPEIEREVRPEQYKRKVASSIPPEGMKRIRALVRERGEEKAQNARDFVAARWKQAIPGFAAKLKDRTERGLAHAIRGKWRAPALASGALVGAGAGAWAANRLGKLTPTQISAAAEKARPPRSLAEAEAGTYRKGHVALHGMKIAIETPKGGERLGFTKDGAIKWRAKMPAHYGYVKGSMGADGDHVDVYLGPRAHDLECPVFVVDQHNLAGAFDEHKAVLGCRTNEEAIRIYDAGFADGSGPRRRRGVTEMSVAAFRAKVMAGKMAKPLAKVAPDDGNWRQPDLFEDMVSTPAANEEEKALAARLAEMFRGWLKDPQRTGNRADVERALDPLYGILRTGMDAVPPPPGDTDTLPRTPDARELGVNFDMRSAVVERRLREYALDRIRAITQESRDAIRGTLIDAAQRGLPVQEQARRIRESVGLSPGQRDWISSYRASLEALDARVLERELRDRRFDGPIRRAIEVGQPLAAEDIDRYVEAYQRRTLAYRALTIARTESLRAANTGMVEGARELLNEHQDVTVEKVWIATKDSRTRDAHRELDGKRVIGMDVPFEVRNPKTGQIEQIRWPHDPQASASQVVNCRCTFGIRLIPKPGAGRFIAEAA